MRVSWHRFRLERGTVQVTEAAGQRVESRAEWNESNGIATNIEQIPILLAQARTHATRIPQASQLSHPQLQILELQTVETVLS